MLVSNEAKRRANAQVMRKEKAISVRGVPVRGHFINAYAMKTVVIKFYDHHFTAGMGGGMLDESFETHTLRQGGRNQEAEIRAGP